MWPWKERGAPPRKECYTNYLTTEERIDVSFSKSRGKVVEFSVCYQAVIDGEWVPIRRCDNSHEEKDQFARQGLRGHCHVFDLDGKGSLCDNKVVLGEGTPAEHMNQILEDFKENHEQIRRLYFELVEKSKRQKSGR